MRDLTFAEVCKFIKEDDPGLIDAVDSFLTIGLLLSPFAFGIPMTAVEPALGLLTLKNELIKQGKKLFEKVTAKDDSEPEAKQQRMFAAYGLVCYTSYFDTLDRQIPEVKRLLGLTATDRFTLSTKAAERIEKQSTVCGDPVAPQRIGPCEMRLPIPHPAETFERIVAKLRPLYLELTKGLIALLEGFAGWDSATEDKRKEIQESIRQLPEKATGRFEAQYFVLCSRYHDFFALGPIFTSILPAKRNWTVCQMTLKLLLKA